MESTPPYHRSNTKSASRLALVNNSNQEVSLDLVLASPNQSPVSLRSSSSPVPLHDLVLKSLSPLRKSDRLEMASENAAVVRKRGKGKGGQKGLLASPRNLRRSRRRSEAVEDKEANLVMDEIVKPRKRKTNGRPKKDKQSVLAPPCSSSDLPSTLLSLRVYHMLMCFCSILIFLCIGFVIW